MKTRILVKEGEYRLAKAFCMDPKIDAQELYCFLTGTDKVSLFMKAEEEVDPETEQKYMELIEKRASRIPLQHITGVQEFMGYSFNVNPDVLIPRQDTETLVSEAAKTIQGTPREKLSFFEKLKGGKEWDVLDLCCGSGAVGISIAKICGNTRVTASDVSEKAESQSEVRDRRYVRTAGRSQVRYDRFQSALHKDQYDIHTPGRSEGSRTALSVGRRQRRPGLLPEDRRRGG